MDDDQRLPSVVRMRTAPGGEQGMLEVIGMHSGPPYVGAGGGSWRVDLCDELPIEDEIAYWRAEAMRARALLEEAAHQALERGDRIIELQDRLLQQALDDDGGPTRKEANGP